MKLIWHCPHFECHAIIKIEQRRIHEYNLRGVHWTRPIGLWWANQWFHFQLPSWCSAFSTCTIARALMPIGSPFFSLRGQIPLTQSSGQQWEPIVDGWGFPRTDARTRTNHSWPASWTPAMATPLSLMTARPQSSSVACWYRKTAQNVGAPSASGGTCDRNYGHSARGWDPGSPLKEQRQTIQVHVNTLSNCPLVPTYYPNLISVRWPFARHEPMLWSVMWAIAVHCVTEHDNSGINIKNIGTHRVIHLWERLVTAKRHKTWNRFRVWFPALFPISFVMSRISGTIIPILPYEIQHHAFIHNKLESHFK